MKTTVNLFSGIKQINPRSLQLPAKLEVDEYVYGLMHFAFTEKEPLKLDTTQLYHNMWVTQIDGIFVPDFGTFGKKGYYLTQTDEMKAIRDTTLECSFCHSQYKASKTPFCLECLHHYELSEDELYKLYLRPVSTMDIEINPKSIRIPPWLMERFNNVQLSSINTDTTPHANNQ